MWQQLKKDLVSSDVKALARCISLVENEAEGYEEFMEQLPAGHAQVIGITGPPGAGKSTLTDALTSVLAVEEKKIAILCIDPSSPFNLGALLGDRIRMSRWFNHSNIFIRSLATRGSLGGLNAKIIEISELVRAAGYDYIIIETVGVGQSEVEIAGLADVTLVTMVPEAGDEVQTMKAGLMEIADIFVVNKADRPGADTFVKNLRLMLAPSFSNHAREIPIIKTIATTGEGIPALTDAIKKLLSHPLANTKKQWLLAEKAWQLIVQKRMKGISKQTLQEEIEKVSTDFNLYAFIKQF
ncbi:MAG: methylmalonyl Co-A mutase-associated GTPase MeaB [Ferruginibacter sp.]